MKRTYDLRSSNVVSGPTPNDTHSQRPATVNPLKPDTSVTMPRQQQQPVDTDAPATEPTLSDLHKLFTDFSGKITSKLNDMHTDISSINKKMADLEAAVEDNSARVLDLEKEKLPQVEMKLRKEIEQLKEKIVLSEIYQRKANLLFYGLEQKANENVVKVLREAFVVLGLSEEESLSISIANAHRLPSRNTSSNAPQPIIAKFVYMNQRDRLISAYERSTRRGGTAQSDAPPRPRISVRTDLPPALKAARGALAAQAYKLRKEKNLSTKISLVGAKVVLYAKAKNSTEWHPYKD